MTSIILRSLLTSKQHGVYNWKQSNLLIHARILVFGWQTLKQEFWSSPPADSGISGKSGKLYGISGIFKIGMVPAFRFCIESM